LIIRLNGEELMDDHGGNGRSECIEFMKMAEQAGTDCVSIVVGWHESTRGALGRDVHDDQWLPLAEKASQALKIPVAFGPPFCDPVKAEQALAKGAFGLWAVCRPFLADPELLHKVAEDRLAIPGAEHNHVVIAHAILEEGSPCGDRAVVLGGERIGLVAAEYLASRGKQVTIVEVGKTLGEDVIATFKWRHAAWVRELQIHTLMNAQARPVVTYRSRVCL
jgi:NADPH-dependent 2,4-dienoyl-CoA reductase/sulfur reductase-like enzyme